MPGWTRQVPDGGWRNAGRYRYAEYTTAVSQGYNPAIAEETALKPMETDYVATDAFSAADFRHGPIGRDFPVFAFAPLGKARPGTMALIHYLASKRGARMMVVTHEEASGEATAAFDIPADCPEVLSPILRANPSQILAVSLARLQGMDADMPRGLSKVTEAR